MLPETQDPQQDPELETSEELEQEDAQGSKPQPRYVTEDALDEIVSRAVNQAVSRINQSSRDRAKRIDAEIENIKTRLSKTNVSLTTEQEAGLRQQGSDYASLGSPPGVQRLCHGAEVLSQPG